MDSLRIRKWLHNKGVTWKPSKLQSESIKIIKKCTNTRKWKRHDNEYAWRDRKLFEKHCWKKNQNKTKTKMNAAMPLPHAPATEMMKRQMKSGKDKRQPREQYQTKDQSSSVKLPCLCDSFFKYFFQTQTWKPGKVYVWCLTISCFALQPARTSTFRSAFVTNWKFLVICHRTAYTY